MNAAFEVRWQLDEEEDLNLASLLGEIKITDGQCSLIEQSVYLDSWFEPLLRAANVLSKEEIYIEIPEHPQKLAVWCDEADAVHLMFKEAEVIATSVQSFRSGIIHAAQEFLLRTESIPGNPEPHLREVRKLLKTMQ